MTTQGDSHEQLEELIAGASLDGLDDADLARLERELAAHGSECQECRRLRAQHAEAAAALALALEPVPMSPGAEERALAAVRALDLGEPNQRIYPARDGSVRPGKRTGMRGRRWIAAIAAAAALVVAAGGGYLLRGGSQGTSSDFLAFISSPETKSIQFPPRGEEQLALYYRPGEQAAWIAGSRLPPPAGNGVYELWYRTPGATAMTPAGTFVSSGDAVTQPVTLGTSFDTVAVSVEPHENHQPTGPVVFQMSVPAPV